MAMEQETIEVLYALMDKSGKYSKFVGTSICSMFENTKSKVRVHIFHDGSIKGENKRNFEILADKYHQEIVFYNVRKLQLKVLQEAERIMKKALKDNRYTEAALYRLLAPQILPKDVGRLIYLDADTLVNMDILKLWKEKIGSSGMAAVFEGDFLAHYKIVKMGIKEDIQKLLDYFETLGVKLEDGFNSGVLLMDLEIIRKMDNLLLAGLKVMVGTDSDNNFYDQNILNFYFGANAYHLPWSYNILQHWDREFTASRNVAGIYHYMGRSLTMDENELRDTVFYDYLLKTPWGSGRLICRMFDELEKIYLRYMEKRFAYMREIVANLGSKKLVLAASSSKEEKLYELLQKPDTFILKATYPKVFVLPGYVKRPDEKKEEEAKPKKKQAPPPVFPENVTYFSLGEDGKMNLNLPYDVDEYFYLFFVGDYIRVKVMLEQAGLEEKGHFMNGSFLLEEIIEGGAINPNKLVDML